MTVSDPIFKAIFGESWDRLPPVMRAHYDVRPYSRDLTTVEGVMDVTCCRYLKPLFRLLGTVPAVSATGVPVTVHFSADPASAAFHFRRIFHFSHRKPYHFHSRMTQAAGAEVLERMKYGLCWRSTYAWTGAEVQLRHKGYAWQIGPVCVPLPLTWLIGRGDATEHAIDDKTFDMRATITHPLLGVVYEYKGRFTIT